MNTIPAYKGKIYAVCQWDDIEQDYGPLYYYCKRKADAENYIDIMVSAFYGGINSTNSALWDGYKVPGGIEIFLVHEIHLR